MAYQPLARKYRPQTFSELVGQGAVVQALGNAIELGRHPPTIIFSGVRGIGKTTSARLYAKALNCDKGPTPDPCNQCESCININSGSHEDVMEIDGASNTGVNDVRELQETVTYAAQRSKFKIYIIDEVHMLSKAAFNALLKTLEEPPAHVVFIFATTELHKIPVTISSRMPTFFLKKISTKVIKDRAAQILDCEGIEYDDNALAVVAREGHGSMRDALTMLDQAIALGSGKVTLESLGHLVSNLSSSPYLKCLSALAERNGNAVIESLEGFDQAGIEFSTVTEEVARMARHAFVAKDLGADALDTELLGMDDAELSELMRISENAQPFDLNRIFRTLIKCIDDLSGVSLDRFIVENYMLEWCFDPGLPNIEALMNSGKGAFNQAQLSSSDSAPPDPAQSSAPGESGGVKNLGRMRQMMEDLKSNKGKKPQPAPKVAATETISEQSSSVPDAEEIPSKMSFPESWRSLVDAYKKIRPLAARKLEEAHGITYSSDEITLVVDEASFASKSLLNIEEQKLIERAFAELFSFNGRLKCIPKSRITVAQQAIVSALEQENEQRERQTQENIAVATPVAEKAIDVPMPSAEHEQGQVVVGEALPDTLLEVRSKEAEIRRQKRQEEAKSAPFTKEMLAQFDGTIENVIMHEDRP